MILFLTKVSEKKLSVFAVYAQGQSRGGGFDLGTSDYYRS
jgi:hypothetical protein